MRSIFNKITDNVDYVSWKYGDDILLAVSLIALMLIINL